MAFAKGPMPRDYSYKDMALEIQPKLKCRHHEFMSVRAYVIYSDNEIVCADSTASRAWEKAYYGLQQKLDTAGAGVA